MSGSTPSGRSKASGYVLKRSDAPIIMGMVARGDRDHDIAAWFGVNQGRIAETKDGSKFGAVAPAAADQLPPKGPPGIKGQRLRRAIKTALGYLEKDAPNSIGFDLLEAAAREYDKNEA